MKILNKVNFGLKEIVNSESATKVMKDYSGVTLNVTGILIGVKDDIDQDTGECKSVKIAVLKSGDDLISSISPTVVNSAETIISAYADNNILDDIAKGIEINVMSSKSSKGRQFFFLQLK